MCTKRKVETYTQLLIWLTGAQESGAKKISPECPDSDLPSKDSK